MANEYLKRTPTSTGNRRVFTWSGWIKQPKFDGSTLYTLFNSYSSGYPNRSYFLIDSDGKLNVITYEGAYVLRFVSQNLFRDNSSWTNILFSVDTTKGNGAERVSLFSNGAKLKIDETNYNEPSINYQTYVNLSSATHGIGYDIGLGGRPYNGQMSDVFFVDGQALTPDVFGFYKQGKGYISAGSTQATDFRPGQWVPKTPRVIKAQIERNGGFGVNGFYLPMNDSSNFGADFHTTPNSIITLKGEDLPQPRNGAPTTTDAYVSQLRTDPYAANLVLALPFVSGGLSSGFGDYAPNIKGSGTPKTMSSGSVSIASTAGYYGTAANFQNSNSYVDTPGTSGDFNMGTGDFTIEGWFYPTGNGGNARLFGQNTNTYNAWDVYIDGSSATGQLYMMGSAYQLTTASIRGNQWNHVAISRKNLVWTTYINGVAAGIVTSIVNNTVGDSTNKFRVGAIGENAYGGVGYSFQGYIQDFRVYKGVAKYTGGFDVPKPYTPVGIATWRQVPDTTANNFATLNPLLKSDFSSGDRSLSNGNLTVQTVTTGNATNARSTVGVSTGKWYLETYVSAETLANQTAFIGVTGIGRTDNQTSAYNGDRIYYYANGQKYDYTDSATFSSYGSSYTVGDIISIAINADNGQVTFYKNGVSQGVAKTFSSTLYPLFVQMEDGASSYYAVYNMNFGQNPTFSGNTTVGTFTDSSGKGLFKYEPPSGFLALCEDNLPTPAIKNPGEYFKTVLWTGDGVSGRSIVGVGFTPDLVWVKERTGTSGHFLTDSVRGVNELLSSNLTNGTISGGGQCITSFNQDGFSIGNDGAFNENTQTYVAWCWRAGAGTTTANTDGTIPSVVSVNQDAGFSIVSFTGTGASGATVGHGLGRKPAFIVSKSRDNGTYAWHCWHKGLGTDYYINLNSTGAQDNSVNIFPSAGITSTVYQTATSALKYNNFANERYVVYCWAEIEGFSKFGSYVGNGNADGVFVYCGFKPAFVLIKKTSGTDNWAIKSNHISTNPNDFTLLPDRSDTEYGPNNTVIDLVSNGFKIRTTSGLVNTSGATYIFAAFAESPFQTANAK